MIYGNIHSYTYDGSSEALRKAFEVIKNTDFSDYAPGRQTIDGDSLYVNVADLETVIASERPPEAHNKYADIHVVMEGVEKIGIAPRDDAQVIVKDLLDTEDAVLFQPQIHDEHFLILNPGDFCLCMPEDIHRPACAADAPARLHKYIMKVLL